MLKTITSRIDHAVLSPTQTLDDLEAACEMCLEFKPASICVKPADVHEAVRLLWGSPIKVSTVIGFPHGGTTTHAKMAEAVEACDNGALELDMVVNIGRVLAGDWECVESDVRGVVETARNHSVLTKVIFETGLLPDDAKIRLCQISEDCGAAYVKTSTGFGMVKNVDGVLTATGATEHDVALLRKHVSDDVGVKASGGVRTLSDARRFIELGATRLGTSSTEAIAREELGQAEAPADAPADD